MRIPFLVQSDAAFPVNFSMYSFSYLTVNKILFYEEFHNSRRNKAAALRVEHNLISVNVIRSHSPAFCVAKAAKTMVLLIN